MVDNTIASPTTLPSGFETSNTTKEIYPSLISAQAKFIAVGKSKENREQHFKFASLDDYFNVLREPLAENDLAIICNIEEITPIDRGTTKAGTRWNAVRVRIRQRLLHKSGEWIDFTSYGEGMDTGDKSLYKAITGARKYALTLLGLATTDDPDETSPEPGTSRQRTTQTQPSPQSGARRQLDVTVAPTQKPPTREKILAVIPEREASLLDTGAIQGANNEIDIRIKLTGVTDLNQMDDKRLLDYAKRLRAEIENAKGGTV